MTTWGAKEPQGLKEMTFADQCAYVPIGHEVQHEAVSYGEILYRELYRSLCLTGGGHLRKSGYVKFINVWVMERARYTLVLESSETWRIFSLSGLWFYDASIGTPTYSPRLLTGRAIAPADADHAASVASTFDSHYSDYRPASRTGGH
jgi:hypothetical protein